MSLYKGSCSLTISPASNLRICFVPHHVSLNSETGFLFLLTGQRSSKNCIMKLLLGINVWSRTICITSALLLKTAKNERSRNQKEVQWLLRDKMFSYRSTSSPSPCREADSHQLSLTLLLEWGENVAVGASPGGLLEMQVPQSWYIKISVWPLSSLTFKKARRFPPCTTPWPHQGPWAPCGNIMDQGGVAASVVPGLVFGVAANFFLQLKVSPSGTVSVASGSRGNTVRLSQRWKEC